MLFCKFLLGLKVQYFLALPSHESTCRCGVWDDHVPSPAPPWPSAAEPRRANLRRYVNCGEEECRIH